MEKKVILYLKKRNEDAFQWVLKEYQEVVYYNFLEKVKNRSIVDTYIDKVFEQMMNKIDSYQENDDFLLWLFLLVDEVISMNKLSKNANDKKNDYKALMNKVARVLTEKEFNIVNYKMIYKLKDKQIAPMMNVNVQDVKEIYKKSVSKLKLEWGK